MLNKANATIKTKQDASYHLNIVIFMILKTILYYRYDCPNKDMKIDTIFPNKLEFIVV